MVCRILLNSNQSWRIFFTILLSAMFSVSHAHRQQTDSLNLAMQGKTDRERADIFYALAYQHGEHDYTLAAHYSDQSLLCAKRAGDSLRIVKAARIKASIFRRLEKMDSSISLGLQMLPIALRNHYHDEIKKILRGLALAYTYKANLDLGLFYNFELLRMTEQDRDSAEQRFALNNIGLVYFKLENIGKALHYFRRALDIKLSWNNPQMTRVLLNTSLCYSELKD